MVGGRDDFDVVLSHGGSSDVRRIRVIQRIQNARVRLAERKAVDFVSQIELLTTWEKGKWTRMNCWHINT